MQSVARYPLTAIIRNGPGLEDLALTWAFIVERVRDRTRTISLELDRSWPVAPLTS